MLARCFIKKIFILNFTDGEKFQIYGISRIFISEFFCVEIFAELDSVVGF